MFPFPALHYGLECISNGTRNRDSFGWSGQGLKSSTYVFATTNIGSLTTHQATSSRIPTDGGHFVSTAQTPTQSSVTCGQLLRYQSSHVDHSSQLKDFRRLGRANVRKIFWLTKSYGCDYHQGLNRSFFRIYNQLCIGIPRIIFRRYSKTVSHARPIVPWIHGSIGAIYSSG